MESIVILAAGTGSRCNLGYNKLLYKINGKMLIEYTMDAFKGFEIILVVHENEYELFKSLFDCKIVIGGATRQISVYNGVNATSNENVLIHDGARIFVTKDIVNNVRNGLLTANAVCPVIKVSDSVKNELGNSVDRDKLFLAQTPQGIKKSVYMKCYDEKLIYTDDVGVLENKDYLVLLVEGSKSNFKITTFEDIEYAKYILGDD